MNKRIVLCTNPYRDKGLVVANKAKSMIEGLGFDATVCLPFETNIELDTTENLNMIQKEAKNCDLIIAFGGDGTILHLAPISALNNIPILGINLGSLGFMSELECSELDQLKTLKNWDFIVEKRMMLDVTAFRNGKAVFSSIGLNDAVISNGSIARVVRLSIETKEGLLTNVTGDGVILSTPTGSTGYSMAAGGPIVEPIAQNFIITPICPHSTRSGSYVLSPDHEFIIKPTDISRKYINLSVDGGKSFGLTNGDSVRVRKAKFTTQLVRLRKKSFCEILDSKMGYNRQ